MNAQHIAAYALLGLAHATAPADVIWSQPWDVYGYRGPAHRWDPDSENAELADEFDLTGTVAEVFADGLQIFGGAYAGAHVRFYEYGANDAPGVLQAEYFFPAGDPALQRGAEGNTYLATLDPPFEASGRHFVSVQPLVDGSWDFKSANTFAPIGQPCFWRDNAAGGDWQQTDGYGWSQDNSDMAFTLYGTITGGPHINELATATLPRSGRLVILGAPFGTFPHTVLVGGIQAWTTTWTNTRIVAFVPEAVGPGPVDVQVITEDGASNLIPLEVTLRQPDGRIRWSFEADGSSLWFRPALAPDGRLYLHSSLGFVYALSPDGGLEWVTPVNWYPYVPPTAGPDGTVYVGSIVSVFAISPAGQILWEFVDGGGQAIQVAPTIGPDGNLYGAFDPGVPGLGAFSLTTGGGLLWNNVGNPPMLEYGGTGAEMRFGPSAPGGSIDQLYVGMDRLGDNYLYAFSLDGDQRWAIPVGPNSEGAEPAIGSDGTVYSTDFIAAGFGWVIRAFDPDDGSSIWLYDGDFISGVSHLDIGPDDMLYYVADLGHLESLDPRTQSLRWSHFTGDVLGRPTVSPDGATIVTSGTPTFGMPGFIKAFAAANGAELWSVGLPGEPYPGMRVIGTDRPRFTPDGRTAYVSTYTVSGDEGDPFSRLYAVAIEEALPGDVDGDGTVGILDFLGLLASWGPCPGPCPPSCAADFDGDCQVGVTDFLILLANWG